MAGLRGFAGSLVLALVLIIVLLTTWACMVAGVVWMLAAVIGPGPALLSVGGGMGGLVLLSVLVALILRGPVGARPPARAPAGFLRAVMTVATMPGGPRLLLGLSAVVFAILAAVALLLATRRSGKGPDDPSKAR